LSFLNGNVHIIFISTYQSQRETKARALAKFVLGTNEVSGSQ